MREQKFYFELAGLRLCAVCRDGAEPDSRLLGFACAEGEAEATVSVRCGNPLPPAGKDECAYRGEVYEEFVRGGRRYRRMRDDSQYLILPQDLRDDLRAELVLNPQYAAKRSCFLANNLAPEVLLLPFGAFFLHASVVRWKSCGIVFTAPSGVGKSTQAELWKTLMGAEILNGDRALIRNFAEGAGVYGSPFCGSSQIIRNESAQLKMIIVLEQAKKNRLCRMGRAEAFVRLYSEVLSNPWNQQFVSAMTEELARLLARVPVYLLQCRPDREAVELVKQEIEREYDEEGSE